MNYLIEQVRLFNKKRKLKNSVILKFIGEGCQARDEFQWVGKVVDFKWSEENKWDEIIIQILKHNFSYDDNRNSKEPELYTYPLVNEDIQYVNGVWILFT